MRSAEPRLHVYILNWNGGDGLAACIETVLGSEGVAPVVHVVDNASSDGSPERAESILGPDRIIRTGENRGYAAGMNVALEHLADAGGELALLLTQDARIAPDALRLLYDVASGDPQVGVVGPIVVFREKPRRLISAGGYLDVRRLVTGHHREILATEPYPVDWLDGCCLLVRREAVAAVGGFDEGYFLYFEDADLGCRLARAGWRVVVEPRARADHDKSAVPGAYYFHYMVRNRYRFWRNNYGVGVARVGAAVAWDTARIGAAMIRAVVMRRDDGEPPVERLRRLRRQLRGAVTGTVAALRGETGASLSVRPAGPTPATPDPTPAADQATS